MSEPRELHAYDYVPLAYERVREALRSDAAGLFQRATVTAASRAEDVVAHLSVAMGAIEIGADVKIQVHYVSEETSALGERTTRLELSWSATRAAGLFPSMQATFSIYPLSATETQLDLSGRYRPPLGLVGNAVDALVGHRVAEASVLRFVQDVRARLETELGHSR